MRFTAFDFETANPSALSACELAVAVFEVNGRCRLKEVRSWRFPPTEGDFSIYNTKVHNICCDDVDGLDDFASLWPSMEPYFVNSDAIVAHNSSYDVRYLCSHLDHFGFRRPGAPVRCTQRMAERRFPELAPFNLPSLCERLGIPLQHHVAASDAVATGQLCSHFLSRCGLSGWDDCETRLCDWIPATAVQDDDREESGGIGFSITPRGVEFRIPIRSRQTVAPVVEREVDPERIQLLTRKAHEFLNVARQEVKPFLTGWAFAMTGELVLGDGQRGQTIEVLQKLGAEVKAPNAQFFKRGKNGFGPTNALIVSEDEACGICEGGKPTGKFFDALMARNEGKPMVLLTEEALYELVAKGLTENVGRESYVEERAAEYLWKYAEEFGD